MKQLRNWVPLLGILALIVLFFKLPDTPSLGEFFECKLCTSSSPFLPLLGSGYFALLVAIALLFPSFPNRIVARIGLLWAIVLFIGLSYINYPNWCVACIIAHTCHILMWAIWVVVPVKRIPITHVRERVILALTASMALIAFFGSLNLSFMAYNLHTPQSLQSGDTVPAFFTKTPSKGILINFVAPGCPYCKEQLKVINPILQNASSYRFINITPVLSPELIQESPHAEWIEDKDAALRYHFKVSSYPTLFLVTPDGKIKEVIEGNANNVEEDVTSFVSKK